MEIMKVKRELRAENDVRAHVQCAFVTKIQNGCDRGYSFTRLVGSIVYQNIGFINGRSGAPNVRRAGKGAGVAIFCKGCETVLAAASITLIMATDWLNSKIQEIGTTDEFLSIFCYLIVIAAQDACSTRSWISRRKMEATRV